MRRCTSHLICILGQGLFITETNVHHFSLDLTDLCLDCDGKHWHAEWGVIEDGTFATASEAECPMLLCQHMSIILLSYAQSRGFLINEQFDSLQGKAKTDTTVQLQSRKMPPIMSEFVKAFEVDGTDVQQQDDYNHDATYDWYNGSYDNSWHSYNFHDQQQVTDTYQQPAIADTSQQQAPATTGQQQLPITYKIGTVKEASVLMVGNTHTYHYINKCQHRQGRTLVST